MKINSSVFYTALDGNASVNKAEKSSKNDKTTKKAALKLAQNEPIDKATPQKTQTLATEKEQPTNTNTPASTPAKKETTPETKKAETPKSGYAAVYESQKKLAQELNSQMEVLKKVIEADNQMELINKEIEEVELKESTIEMAVPRKEQPKAEATEKNNQETSKQITYEEVLKNRIEMPKQKYTPVNSQSAYSETQNKMQQELDKINERMLAHIKETQEEKQANTGSIDIRLYANYNELPENINPALKKRHEEVLARLEEDRAHLGKVQEESETQNEIDQELDEILSGMDDVDKMRLRLKLRFPQNTVEIDNMTDSELEEKYLEIQNIISNSLETGFNPFN